MIKLLPTEQDRGQRLWDCPFKLHIDAQRPVVLRPSNGCGSEALAVRDASDELVRPNGRAVGTIRNGDWRVSKLDKGASRAKPPGGKLATTLGYSVHHG